MAVIRVVTVWPEVVVAIARLLMAMAFSKFSFGLLKLKT
jgi:hypothetical protein